MRPLLLMRRRQKIAEIRLKLAILKKINFFGNEFFKTVRCKNRTFNEKMVNNLIF